jgi:XRE family transcriptional regulator of biofilm formation
MNNIGERIKEERTAKGLSLDKLSKQADVSKTYLSEIENNVKQNPSAEVLLRIAQALNVSLPYLLEGDAKKERIDDKPIPEPLKEAALELDLKFSQVLQLLETRNIALARRGKKVEGQTVSKEAWIKLYQTLKEQDLI